jgi:hypothetical protein
MLTDRRARTISRDDVPSVYGRNGISPLDYPGPRAMMSSRFVGVSYYLSSQLCGAPNPYLAARFKVGSNPCMIRAMSAKYFETTLSINPHAAQLTTDLCDVDLADLNLRF